MRSNKIHNADLFTDAANEGFRKHVKTQSKEALTLLDQMVDWPTLVKPLERSLARQRSMHHPAGRKPADLTVIVKCFILQSLYGLSDPRLEEEIADRRSFQMFLGLVSHDAIPDETTICRYRKLFAEHGWDKRLFSAFNAQLSKRGLIVGKGTIIDATLKEAQATAASGRDTDAGFTLRRHRIVHGYKGHVGMDAETNVIHSVTFTPANVHDTHVFDELLLGSERIVYADKGYAQRERRRHLAAAGIRDGILHKGYRNHPLTQRQKQRNKRLSRIRSQVERPFGFFIRVLHYDRCRYYDLIRNRFQFLMSTIIHNMRRLLTQTHPRLA